MCAPNGAHATWEEVYIVLRDRDAPYALRNLNFSIDGALIAYKHAGNAAAQSPFRLFSRGDVEITSVALLDVHTLVLFERLRIARRRRARRMARHRLGGVVAVGHGLETRRGRRGRRPRGERGEDARGEAARDAQPRVLPELPAQGRLALGEEDGEDGEAVGEAVLHDAGGDDAARGQEGAACFGGFAGREEEGCFFERAEFLFEEGGELRKGQRG